MHARLEKYVVISDPGDVTAPQDLRKEEISR